MIKKEKASAWWTICPLFWGLLGLLMFGFFGSIGAVFGGTVAAYSWKEDMTDETKWKRIRKDLRRKLRFGLVMYAMFLAAIYSVALVLF